MKRVKNIILSRSLRRFIIVGFINAAFGSAVMFGCYNILGFGYWFSSAANYICASVLSFILNKCWTFEKKHWSSFMALAFVLNIAVCYFAAYSIAKPAIHYLTGFESETVKDNVSMFFGMCVFTALNYFGQRFIVFRDDPAR